jgi:hypothetical protein
MPRLAAARTECQQQDFRACYGVRSPARRFELPHKMPVEPYACYGLVTGAVSIRIARLGTVKASHDLSTVVGSSLTP